MTSKIILPVLIAIILSIDNFANGNNNRRFVATPQYSRNPSQLINGECEQIPGIVSLNFSQAGLRRMESDFANSTHRSCLNLEDNKITYISPSAFRLMPNLLRLNLARNQLSLANFSHLDGHSYLETLILDENHSKSNGNAKLEFANVFPHLVRLSIRSCDLTHLSSLEFAPNLLYLDLSSNDLGSSELTFLDNGTDGLLGLYLADNGFQSFKASNLKMLRDLQLDGNHIQQICGKSSCDDSSALVLEGMTALRWLKLARNELTSIEADAFDDTRELQLLDLSNNQIKSIGKDAFEKIGKLWNLTLSGNSLTEIPDLGHLKQLNHLLLANNRLKSLPNNSFEKNDRLHTIDLSGNQIETVESGAFNKLVYLRILNLSNNALKSLPSTWLRPSRQLKTLHLDNNQFTKLEDLGIESITSYELDDVYLQNNSITNLNSSSFYQVFSAIRIPRNIVLHLFDSASQSNNNKVMQDIDTCACDCE